MENITLTTSDGIKLAGLLWDKNSTKTVLLLHMMPATKESWVELAGQLSEKGVNVLAIDFRGHGESGGGDYKQFTPEQHHEYYKDVVAAVEFLKAKYPHTDVRLAGASIGANMVLKYMAEHGDVLRGMALSAGVDYHGVRAIDFVGKLGPSQQVLFVGSRDDGRSSGQDCGAMAEELFEKAASQKQKIIYDTGGHGTDMTKTHPKLWNEIIRFLLAS